MTSKTTATTLDELAAVRTRIEKLRSDWESQHDTASVIHRLDELSAACATFPSVQALLFGAARVIEEGEPPSRRLDKLSDHLHGYVIGWEDGARAAAP